MGTSVTLETQKISQDWIEIAIADFIQAKRVENLSKGSLKFYRINLGAFASWCDSQAVRLVSQVDASLLRQYFLYLEEVGRNAGGVHAAYRSIRAFLKWHWEENEILTKNPISKVKAPKVPQEPIQGVTMDEFQALRGVCGRNVLGERDRAILMVLLDTGIRADELCSIKMEDVNLGQNAILIAHGKGRKPREVFYGTSTRRQLKHYLRMRGHLSPWLFTGRSGEKLEYDGLREILHRLNIKAGTHARLHDFRRAFTLNQLQHGVDLVTISRLLGHTSISLIARYAKQSSTDLRAKYQSPVG